jgi:hypothetical protein
MQTNLKLIRPVEAAQALKDDHQPFASFFAHSTSRGSPSIGGS